MAQATLQTFLQELHENCNLLKEREAKYGGIAAPVYLLNQIRDYEIAIELANRALQADLNLDDLQAEFSTLNLELRDRVVFVSLEPPRKPFTGQNPYRGLEKFTENEAEFFFGRTSAIQSLLAMVQRLVETETGPDVPDLIAVLGASGSGKSSLVRAGLIPALRRGEVKASERWLIRVLRPGPNPLETLAQYFAGLTGRGLASLLDDLGSGPRFLHLLMGEALADQPDDTRLVLIIDQFEELFTLCQNEAERRDYIGLLLYAAQHRDSRGLILLTMRADFYDKAAGYANLAEVITRHQMLVGPLTEKELREAILLPAEAVGLELEKDLAQALVQDTLEAPGALPLLQHALLELFHRRDGNLLTMVAYQEIGGVKGALARRADKVLAALTPEQQQVARNIFLRLTALGEGVSDTRRRVNRTELYPAGLETAQVEAVLQALTGEKARLVVAGEDTVEVTHEALIQQWGQLRAWLEENREALRTQRRLTEAAAEWQANERDPSYLYSGARLAEAEEWAQTHAADLTQDEQAFLTASLKERERGATEKRRRSQRIIAGLAVGLVLIAIAAVFGFYGQNRAVQSAQTAEARRLEAEAAQGTAVANEQLAAAREVETQRQAQVARAGQLAAQSQAVLEQWPQRSLLLAIEAMQVIPEVRVPGAEQALRNAQFKTGGLPLGDHDAVITAIAFSPDNKWLATGGGDIVILRDMRDLTTPAIILSDPTEYVYTLAFSPDSRWLAAGGNESEARLWNLSNLTTPPIILPGHEAAITALAFSPDNKWLATGSEDQTARLWNLFQPTDPPLILSGHEGPIRALAFSPDNKWLITSSPDDGTTRLWDENDPTTPPVILSGLGTLDDIVISSDSRWLATGATDDYPGDTVLWNLTTPTAPPLILAGSSAQSSMAFSPDNKWLASGGLGDIWLWNLTTPTAPTIFSAQNDEVAQGYGWIYALAFSPDSEWLVAGGDSGVIRLSQMDDLTTSDIFITYGGDHPVATFSPDSKWLVANSGENAARLWNLSNPTSPSIILSGHEDRISGVAISPDNKWLVTSSDDDTSRLWDLTDLTTPPVVLSEYEKLNNYITPNLVTFSPDSKWLVTGQRGFTAQLWSLQPEALIAEACQTVGRNLSTREWEQYFPGQDYRKSCPGLPIHPSFMSDALALTHEGDVEGALAQFQKAVTLEGGQLTLDYKSKMAEILVKDGRYEAGYGLLESALTKFQQALELDPTLELDPEVEALWLVAQDWIRQGQDSASRKDFAEAVAQFQKALELDPTLSHNLAAEVRWLSALLLLEQGQDLAEEGNFEEAVAKFQAALKLDPTLRLDPEAEAQRFMVLGLVEQGQALAGKGNIEEAIAKFEEALKLDPSLGFELEARARQLAAASLVEQGRKLISRSDFAKATTAYIEAQTLDPTLEISADDWNELCWDGSLWGQAVEVLDACEQAVELAPNDASIRDSRGLARALTGDRAGAIEDFEFALAWFKENGYERYSAQREGWIADLKAGKDPFDGKTLEALRNE